MSPLRRWFTSHGHPGWYSWVTVVGTSVTSSALAVYLSVSVVSNDLERRQAEQAAQAERGRLAVCRLIIAQDNALDDPSTPPATQAGRKAAMAWHNLREQFRCDGK